MAIRFHRTILTMIVLVAAAFVGEALGQGGAMPRKIAARSDLAQPELWQKNDVNVFAGGDQVSPRSRVEAISTFYAPPAFGRRDALLAVVVDPYSGQSYLVRGYQAFYLSTEDDLLAFLVDSRFLRWTGSFARTSGNPSNDASALRRLLEQVDDQRLLSTALYESSVDLLPHASRAFFSGGSRGDSSIGIPTATDAAVDGDTLRLELLSDGGKLRGSFLIDLKAKTVLKSSITGQ
jgi:hypothetical protein